MQTAPRLASLVAVAATACVYNPDPRRPAFADPVWLLSWAGAEAAETRSAILDDPDDPLEDFAMWARFPQGMPPGMDPQALVPPTRRGR